MADSESNRDASEDETEPSGVAGVDLLQTLGGKQGIAESGLPGAVFVTVYTVNGQNLGPALWSAIGVAVLLSVWRLVRRESVQFALSGLIGVAIAAFVASRTGRAADFFLPGLLLQAGYALVYLTSIIVRWPLIGVVLGPLFGEGMTWRQNPGRRRAFMLATWAWFSMFVLRLAVQLPLYLLDMTVALGYVKLAMGWPLFAVVAWITFLLIRAAPPAQPVRREEDSP